MANAEQIKALIRSHAEGDDTRFYSVALQVAAQAARNGHEKLARDLREDIDKAKGKARGPKIIAMTQQREDLTGLLAVTLPKTRLAEMTLPEDLHARLQRVLLEQGQRDKIRQYGLQPLRKLLLVGPPGTGKTMTAAALAGEFSLPLFTVQLDSLISKYLGETSSKLRLVFNALQGTRGVYFFDEFDALGGERSLKNDVGEVRRVLNSFLQFLEQDNSDSLIIAATNHANLLDRALFRRFDMVVEYKLPSAEIGAKIMKSKLSLIGVTDIDWVRVAQAAEGLSQADLAHACEQASKSAILGDSLRIRTQELIRALEERRTIS